VRDGKDITRDEKAMGPTSMDKKSNKTPAIKPLKKPQTKKSHEPKKTVKKFTNQKNR
jgi:hypothetical protein